MAGKYRRATRPAYLVAKALAFAVGLLAMAAGSAWAAVTDARFGGNQAFDVQWSFNAQTSVLTTSNMITPYDSNFVAAPLVGGQTYGFFDSVTNPGTYGLAIYDAQNNLVRVLHNTGSFSLLGQSAIFYLGSGFFGTLISTAQGFSNGDAANFTGLTQNPDAAALANYAWPSLTPLAAGQVAAPAAAPAAPPAVSAVGTLVSLALSAADLRAQLSFTHDALVTALGHDSNQFGAHGLSLSFVGRYSDLSGEASAGAGALVGAWRPAPFLRIGAFVDYAPSPATPRTISNVAAGPVVGGFAVFERNSDLTGLSARVSAAFGGSRMTLTRAALFANTEPGVGRTSLNSYAVAAEASFGFRLSESIVVVPHAGMRYSNVRFGGYTEWTTPAVTNPITFNAFGQALTTATAGLRVHASIGAALKAFVGVAAEHDVQDDTDSYSGSSAIPGLARFAVVTKGAHNRTRLSASAGVSYAFSPGQSISAQVAVRQTAYSSKPSVSSSIRYSVGF